MKTLVSIQCAVLVLTAVGAECESLSPKLALRDSVSLRSAAYVPAAAKDGKVGTSLLFSPYKAGAKIDKWAKERSDKCGYARVQVDCRGTGGSEGRFAAYRPDTVDDAKDVLDAIAAQPWSNGRVVMSGGSFPGWTQFCAMRSGSPALVACSPSVMILDPYYLYFSNGCRVDTFQPGWHRKFAGTNDYNEVASHTKRSDPFWERLADVRKLDESKAGVFYQGGWFDMIGLKTMETYNRLRKGGRRVFLRQGPWAHGVNTYADGGIDFKALGGSVTEDLELDFLEKALRGEKPQTDDLPGQILLYVMGRNEWRYETEWPLKGTKFTAWPLGKGKATFRHDPANPVPTCGGRMTPGGGIREQSAVEARADVLKFTGEVLKEDLEVTGDVKAHIVFSSTSVTNDIAVKLVDVWPDGKAYGVVDSICRADDCVPGKAKTIDFPVDSTAYVFLKGHRIRIDVAGSSKPHYEVNPTPAEVTVDAAASNLILPVIPARAASVDTVWESQKARAKTLMPANAARVKADLSAAKRTGAKTAFYAVPAMSDVMRLPDTYPFDGELGGTVGATLAQGEFESASFELFAFEDMEKVELKLSDLKGPGGTLAADLRVVKTWFQNGNAWVSYFADEGLKLVPELLLHDENLIEVDTEKAANYARVMKDGKATKVWISAPKGLDAGFNAYDPGFRDADSIQPVKLAKNAFKQFFLTFHAAKNQKPGVYRGTIAVRRGGAALAEIPVAACVLPFELPMPRGYQNYDQLYFYGAMGSMPDLERIKARCGGDEKRAKACFRNWLQSLYDHSVFHGVDVGPKNVDYALPLLKEIGFPLNPLCGDLMLGWFGLNFGGRMRFDQLMQAKDAAAKCKAFYDKYLPGSEIWCGHGDEQGTAFVTAHREFFKYYNEKGIRIGCAGHDALMIKGGYAYGYYPMGGYPNTLEKARPWHEINGKPVGFYASQHNGSENPQFVRYQHGLLGYLSGLTMTFNYEFATGSNNGGWSDLANELYKPMVITHANGDGLMETLAYAGFREGCDDIRYATYLKGLCREAREKGKIEAKIAAEKALQYLALLNREEMDLNAVRAEMIEHILKVRKELGK